MTGSSGRTPPAKGLGAIIENKWHQAHQRDVLERAKLSTLPWKYRIAEWTLPSRFAPIILYMLIGALFAFIAMCLLGFEKPIAGDAGRPDKAWYRLVETHGLVPIKESLKILGAIDEPSRGELLDQGAIKLNLMVARFLEQIKEKKSIVEFLNQQILEGNELKEILKLQNLSISTKEFSSQLRRASETYLKWETDRFNNLQNLRQSEFERDSACKQYWDQLQACLRKPANKK